VPYAMLSAMHSARPASYPWLTNTHCTPPLLPPQSQAQPRVATRAVCGAWVALRAELVALQELRRQAGRDPLGKGAGSEPKSKKRR
jgi:hypothetical protein